MRKRIVSEILLTLLLFACSTIRIPPARASETIYIRADGSIDPPTASITTVDNVTYLLTDNIYDSIVVERNNIVVDGTGYSVTGSGNGTKLVGMSNVTLRNITIKNFDNGIFLDSSSNSTLSGNNVANNIHGIVLTSSDNNVLSGNNVRANEYYGIRLENSSGNSIFHNSFVDIRRNYAKDSNNIWDLGFRLGGNYWSDYGGVDSDHDGIGNSNYTIDAGNVDRYPLMGTFNRFSASLEFSVETICNSTISAFTFNGTAISFNVSGQAGTAGFCRICIPTAHTTTSTSITRIQRKG